MRVFYSLFATCALMACAHTAPAPTSQPIKPLKISGRLAKASLLRVESASLGAYAILADGRLAPLVSHTLSSRDDGRYELRVGADQVGEHGVLVRVDSEVGSGLVVVSIARAVDGEVAASPIDDTTTVAAQVYLAAIGSGTWPAQAEVTRLQTLLSPALSAATLGDRELGSTLGILAKASVAATQAWRAALTHEAVGVQPAQLKATTETLDWASLTTATGMDRAQTGDDAVAVQASHDAVALLAYAQSAIRPEQLTTAAQAMAAAFEVYGRLLSRGTQTQAFVDMERLRATHMTRSIDSVLGFFAPEPVRQAARAKGRALLLRLGHAAGAEAASSRAAMREAWTDYRQDVAPALTEALRSQVSDAAPALLSREAQKARETLEGLDAAASPAAVAEQASAALATLYGAATREVRSHMSEAAPEARRRATEALATWGNLELAAP